MILWISYFRDEAEKLTSQEFFQDCVDAVTSLPKSVPSPMLMLMLLLVSVTVFVMVWCWCCSPIPSSHIH